ncbi:MAG: hypothetical protein CMG75_09075 [Candidatus Marinimicrobia bacterium]|nr:hypothetical protein [Candidatus Neomarinimicrobiota bacterium]|tara:strand:- start:24916 stop:25224 length:309 start_codon:yes stop_codon:yes gene_type:complete
MSNWYKISDAFDLTPGNSKILMFKEKTIALFNIGGNFVAIDNQCPHRGGSLGDGKIEGSIVTCPWHSWKFDCLKGTAVENKNFRLKIYPLKKLSDGLFVKLF